MNINWYRCEKQASFEKIQQISSLIGVQFPRGFQTLMMKCDAGVPVNTGFKYFDKYSNRIASQAIGGFLGFIDKTYNILNTYQQPPEFFPEGLVAFAEPGNGDYICFDYRQGKDNPDPPVVYWNHEADIGKDVSFIADNFEEFIGILKESDY